MTQNIHITVYGTQGCHLCEQAEQVLHQALSGHPIALYCAVEYLDIVENESLYKRYELRIPVLKMQWKREHTDEANTALAEEEHPCVELNWPFTPEQIVQALNPDFPLGDFQST